MILNYLINKKYDLFLKKEQELKIFSNKRCFINFLLTFLQIK